ncbi:MAG: hypothetical protein IPK69_00575 [Phycisphaerales bacterium]|nr:MAG: hypothetical protein IPK69_00575 [Phycisphaerales bacterium]
MSHPRTRHILWTIVLVLAIAATLTPLAAAVATRKRHMWNPATWPQFVGVHKSNMLIFSSIWKGGLTSTGWMYDGLAINTSPWRPTYPHIGNVYGGTPPISFRLHAIAIPLWNLALPPLALAYIALRRSRRYKHMTFRGQCPNCGYPGTGLPNSGSKVTCPECGQSIISTAEILAITSSGS